MPLRQDIHLRLTQREGSTVAAQKAFKLLAKLVLLPVQITWWLGLMEEIIKIFGLHLIIKDQVICLWENIL